MTPQYCTAQERTMVAKPMQPSAARAVATPQQGVQDAGDSLSLSVSYLVAVHSS